MCKSNPSLFFFLSFFIIYIFIFTAVRFDIRFKILQNYIFFIIVLFISLGQHLKSISTFNQYLNFKQKLFSYKINKAKRVLRFGKCDQNRFTCLCWRVSLKWQAYIEISFLLLYYGVAKRIYLHKTQHRIFNP